MNKAILIGRITKDLELRNTQGGTAVTNFGLAVQRRFKGQSGEYETDFINCIAWKGTAEFLAKHFHKGDMIAIVGNIQTRKWDDDKGTHYATEVVIEEAYFCGSKNSNAGQQNGAAKPSSGTDNFTSSDDLPF